MAESPLKKFFYCSMAPEELIGVALVFAVTSVLIMIPYLPRALSLKVGQPSGITLLAPRTASIETPSNRVATAQLKHLGRKNVKPVYLIDPAVTEQTKHGMRQLFRYLHEQRRLGRHAPIRDKSLPALPTDLLEELYSLNDDLFSSVEIVVKLMSDRFLEEGISESLEVQWDIQLSSEVERLQLSPYVKSVTERTLRTLLKPNAFFSAEATDKARELAVKKISEQRTTFREDQPILYKNEVVTEEHIEILRAFGLIGGHVNRLLLVALILANAIVLLIGHRLLVLFAPEIRSNPKLLTLMGVTLVTVLTLANGLRLLPQSDMLPYPLVLLPMAALSTSLILCMRSTAALILMSSSVMQMALFARLDVYWLLGYLFSIATAAAMTRRIEQRGDLMKIGLWVGLYQTGFWLLLSVLLEKHDLRWLVTTPALGMLNGILGAVIMIGLLPFLENAFNITTSLRLLELSNLNHPLLKKIMREAPGTYHHSLGVANLAEAACEAIGADGLVGRVCAYYHDLGKTRRPAFFVENQFDGVNPHENIAPSLSAMIITSHTKDGVDLGLQSKLPQVILDGMVQHHGTGLVSFFYYKILQQVSLNWEKDEELKNKFRYNGTKPQYKEMGVLMLADSTEAAVRSLEKTSPHKVENLIQRIIDDHVKDGQLDNCDLSLKDLKTVRAAFVGVYAGHFHQRITYPGQRQELPRTRLAQS